MCDRSIVQDHRSMGNDLQKESELSDDSYSQQQAESDERPTAVTQPALFSSCVDPPPRLQHETEDPGSVAEVTDVAMSKPNYESEESIHQTNECLDQSSSQPRLSQAMPVNESWMTTPPTELDAGTAGLVRDLGMLSSDQYVKVSETDRDDVPPRLEETTSALEPPPFMSICTPPNSRATISSETEQRIEEKGKIIKQPQQSPTVKTIDVSIAGRSTEDSSCTAKTEHSTRTGKDDSSSTGKTGHSTRSKRKRRTTTHKRQDGELMVFHFRWGPLLVGNFGKAINLVIWQITKLKSHEFL